MNRIKELREEKKVLQAELAARLEVSQATLSNWERGVHNPDRENITKLVEIFGCSIDYLLKHSDVRLAVTEEGLPMDQAYYRIAQEAKENGISPQALQAMIDFLVESKQRDDDFNA
ncbi:MAG: helix-turn-helix domain-containing protein [Defluviitaleaceae bacterium]|nr:helix-turn-helix domain-containing protein [Defluviitaleaceae bacterium]